MSHDAQYEESIHRAAEALRTFLHEQETQARDRLLSDAERAFCLALDPQAET